MQRPDQPAAPPPGAAPTSRWRRRVRSAGWVVFIAVVSLAGLLTGLIGLVKVQGVSFPLNVHTVEGCLADPVVVDARAPCPKQAEAVLEYPDGRTVVITGTPQEVKRRVDLATEKVVAAERWRGLGYLGVAALLVGSGIAAIVWEVVRRRPRRTRRTGQSGDAAGSPVG
jgi:hypothetical protein